MLVSKSVAYALPIILVVNAACYAIYFFCFKRPVDPRRGFDVQSITPQEPLPSRQDQRAGR